MRGTIVEIFKMVKLVINDAKDPIEIVRSATDDVKEKFFHTWAYTTSMVNIYLHNYAIAASHRTTSFDQDIDTIRSYLILNEIIETFVEAIEKTELIDAASILNDFHIPHGWYSDETFYRVTSEKYTNM